LYPEIPLLNLDPSKITSKNVTPTHKKEVSKSNNEIEEMRKELKSKDGQIINLRERLLELEDKVNSI
jgi:predicted  nucleic acid-binding Zn-ribbon protein